MSSDKIPESYEVIVIGGGKGGKTLATDLGNCGVKTALIERDSGMIGGSCINVACIPTKSFIASARVAHTTRHANEFGVETGSVAVEWSTVKKRVDEIVSAMRAMNHKNFTSASSLDFILGTARFTAPHVVEVRRENGTVRTLTAGKIFINTGSRPAQIDIPGLGGVGALNSESIQHLDSLPTHLLIRPLGNNLIHR